MTTAIRILSLPFVLVLYVAYQFWTLVEHFPAYARGVWWEWRANTKAVVRYVRIAFHLQSENE